MISLPNRRLTFTTKQPGMGMAGYVVVGNGYRLDIPPHKFGQSMPLLVWAQGGSFVTANIPTAALAVPLSTFMANGFAILNVDFGKQPELDGAGQLEKLKNVLETFDYLPESVSYWSKIVALGQSAGGHHLMFCHLQKFEFDKLCLWGVPVDWTKYATTVDGDYWTQGSSLANQTQSDLIAGSPLTFMRGTFPEVLGVYWLTSNESGDPPADPHDGIGGDDLESKGAATSIYYDPGVGNANLYSGFPVAQVIDHFLS